MQITVLGANGRVGQLVVKQALKNNIEVVALVHKHSSLASQPGLKITRGDIHDVRSINEAIEGSRAVISTLSSWGTRSKDILSTAMNNLVPAMEKKGIKRIVSLTGSDARMQSDHISLLHRLSHFFIGIVGRRVLKDSEKHLLRLSNSQLDWTVVRSPVMNMKGNPKAYSLKSSRSLPWETINRKSVAECLLKLAITDDYVFSAPFIKRTKSA